MVELEKRHYGERLPAVLKEIDGVWWARAEWSPDSSGFYWHNAFTKHTREEIEAVIKDDSNAYIAPGGNLVVRIHLPPERVESMRNKGGFQIGANFVTV